MNFTIVLYFLWVYYSYAKHLALGNWSLIEGDLSAPSNNNNNSNNFNSYNPNQVSQGIVIGGGNNQQYQPPNSFYQTQNSQNQNPYNQQQTSGGMTSSQPAQYSNI